MSEALANLKSRLEEMWNLDKINELLGWDMQTQMPHGGAEARSRHIGVVAS